MDKSSIHISASSHGSVQHNSREKPSHSVVFADQQVFDGGNECSATAKEAYALYRKLLRQRQAAYHKRTGQQMQKKTITKLSAVINLECRHTLRDLQPLIDYIEREFDTVVFQSAIHKDEGKLVHREEGWELYSGIDFFRSPDDGEYYYDKKYTKPIDMSKFYISKNYHAHLEFMGIDSEGRSLKRNYLHRHALSELQDRTAEILGMTRGVKFGEKRRRRDTHEFKREGSAKQAAIRTEKAKIKDLNEQMKLMREELRQMHAIRDDYAAMEAKQAELKKKIKAKELSVENLQDQLDDLRKQLIEEIDAREAAEKKLTEEEAARETAEKQLAAKPKVVEKVEVKTVYMDTPETVVRVARLEKQLADEKKARKAAEKKLAEEIKARKEFLQQMQKIQQQLQELERLKRHLLSILTSIRDLMPDPKTITKPKQLIDAVKAAIAPPPKPEAEEERKQKQLEEGKKTIAEIFRNKNDDYDDYDSSPGLKL